MVCVLLKPLRAANLQEGGGVLLTFIALSYTFWVDEIQVCCYIQKQSVFLIEDYILKIYCLAVEMVWKYQQ